MFRKLKTRNLLDSLENVCLLLMAACIPLDWRWASYVMIALCVLSVCRLCVNGLPADRKERRRCCGTALLFSSLFLIYLLSVCWSDDKAEAWRMVDKKLPFLLFPFWMLFSRPEISGRRLYCILSVFTWSTLVVFAANFAYAAWDVFACGADIRRFFSDGLMKIHYVHHSYMAMYACLGLAFSLFAALDEKRRVRRGMHLLAVGALAVFVLLLESRAGLLTMLLIVFFFWCRLVFLQKRRRLGIASGAAVLLAIALAWICAPSAIGRLTQTLRSLSSETEPDCRVVQTDAYRPMLRKCGLFGYGCGDRLDIFSDGFASAAEQLLEAVRPAGENRKLCMDSLCRRMYFYNVAEQRESIDSIAAAFGCDPASVQQVAYRYLVLRNALDDNYNAHNQYYDTMMAAGWVGLAALLLYFLLPLWEMYRRRSCDPLMLYFLFIVAFNALFESIFERQLGVLFFLFFFFLFYRKNFSNHVYPSDFRAGENAAPQTEPVCRRLKKS